MYISTNSAAPRLEFTDAPEKKECSKGGRIEEPDRVEGGVFETFDSTSGPETAGYGGGEGGVTERGPPSLHAGLAPNRPIAKYYRVESEA